MIFVAQIEKKSLVETPLLRKHQPPFFLRKHNNITDWLVVWNYGILWLSIQLGMDNHPN
jgi:hypothetical protein